MASTTTWIVLVVAGFGLLWAMRYTPQGTLQAITIRLAAFAFIGAGTISAGGWLGQFFQSIIGGVNSIGATFGQSAIGSGAVWVLWAAAATAWVLTILPESWFSKPIPDGLSVAGIFLPSLVSGVPGPWGDALRSMFSTIGRLIVEIVRQGLGG